MSFFSKVGNFLFGGAAEAGVKVADGVADIVERWAPGDEAKHKMMMEINEVITKNASSARQYDPRSMGGGRVGEMINVVIDGFARLIRPGVTILLLGGVFGWWNLPTSDSINPVYFAWAEMVLIFWFGGRTLFKDLPSLILYMKEARNK